MVVPAMVTAAMRMAATAMMATATAMMAAASIMTSGGSNHRKTQGGNNCRRERKTPHHGKTSPTVF
jgi:hypothetical protein